MTQLRSQGDLILRILKDLQNLVQLAFMPALNTETLAGLEKQAGVIKEKLQEVQQHVGLLEGVLAPAKILPIETLSGSTSPEMSDLGREESFEECESETESWSSEASESGRQESFKEGESAGEESPEASEFAGEESSEGKENEERVEKSSPVKRFQIVEQNIYGPGSELEVARRTLEDQGTGTLRSLNLLRESMNKDSVIILEVDEFLKEYERDLAKYKELDKSYKNLLDNRIQDLRKQITYLVESQRELQDKIDAHKLELDNLRKINDVPGLPSSKQKNAVIPVVEKLKSNAEQMSANVDKRLENVKEMVQLLQQIKDSAPEISADTAVIERAENMLTTKIRDDAKWHEIKGRLVDLLNQMRHCRVSSASEQKMKLIQEGIKELQKELDKYEYPSR